MSERLPVVFVHGIRLSRACWVAVTERVAAERPVSAVDLPGHGARRGVRFTVPAAIEAVAEAIEQVGGRALVVGHSLGGYAAIAAAAHHPEKVAGLVVAGSTVVPTRVLTTPFTLAHRLLSAWPDGGERISGRVFDAVLPPHVAEAVKRGGIATEVIPDVVQAARDFDILARLADYPGPTWLVNGGRDYFRRHERRFLTACTHGQLLTVPGAGHYLPLIHPTRFARCVLDIAHAADRRPTPTTP